MTNYKTTIFILVIVALVGFLINARFANDSVPAPTLNSIQKVVPNPAVPIPFPAPQQPSPSSPLPSPTPPPPTPPPPTPSLIEEPLEATVEIKGNQFLPQTVKIKKGGNIIWLNKDGRSSWPASDVHPTHQIYPGFDAIGGIADGESYSFVFDKTGSWNYHDHFSPGVRGAVIVSE